MADFRAVPAVSEAIVELLQARYLAAPQYFNNDLEFLAKDFGQPMAAGVSLFLYRIYPNGTLRNQRGRPGPEGQQYRNQLPLDMHFILTAWAQDPSLQHLIAGWMMRMIEDTPILPPGLLNQNFPDLFTADEGVVITPAELSTEELLRMWEVIIENSYQISVPYVARYVKVESQLLFETGRPIQERTLDLSVPGATP
jgi:Pvc16 N-terminal domain